MEELTLYQYFRSYEVTTEKRPNHIRVGTDGFNNAVYARKSVVRYSDYHPAYQCDAFFYNLLLEYVPFRNEEELIQLSNSPGQYFLECALRPEGCPARCNTVEELEQHVQLYTERHFLKDEQRQHVVDLVLTQHPIDVHPIDSVADIPAHLQRAAQDSDDDEDPMLNMSDLRAEFQDMDGAELSDEQRTVFAALKDATGLHLLEGVPDTCKLTHLPSTHPAFKALLAADVIIVDECSMLTSYTLDTMLYRVQQESIDAALADCVLAPGTVMQHFTADTTILCCHVEQTIQYNADAIAMLYPAPEIVDIPVHTNAQDVPELQKWVNDSTFHALRKVAVGAKVILNYNLDIAQRAANGNTGIVTDIITKNGSVSAITILLDGSTKPFTVRRSSYQYTHWNGRSYFRCTFPLLLGYAMTGHRSQGATIAHDVIVDVGEDGAVLGWCMSCSAG
ncbi:hypothetical protein WJX72_006051 [[Myrmecia] bisecta]|uniref:DNA helicase n=1 Tax=[Myrmecia] bisecta TaxID=41462 RepID=A0AAW1R6V5_9CHLO